MISIHQFHPIFSSPEYQKDVIAFNLMEIIKTAPMLLVSDEKSCIVGMTAPHLPVWIWTSDSISETALSNLCKYFYERFQDAGSVHYVAKPDIASFLANPFIMNKKAKLQRVGMESFECQTVISPRNKTVSPQKPSQEDLPSITECLHGFFLDCFGETITQEDSVKQAQSFINNPTSFVVRQDKKVVSMACSARKTEKYAAINHVYTRPEYRGKGFAAVLVAHICNLILDSGKIPMLYTDLSNPASNKSYQNVGFVACGKVDEITLKWNSPNTQL